MPLTGIIVNLASQLPFVSAACSGALAIGVFLRSRRSIARWTFAAGMAVLAVEAVCGGLTAGATSPGSIVDWQRWRLLAQSLLPGIWLAFSLSYARGNAREFLIKWRLPLAGAFLLPVALAAVFREDLIVSLLHDTAEDHWMLRLGWPGIALYIFLLVGSILVLTNLERTFRASVGTMRWRIKYMVFGVGLLFLVRAYTSSQTLLFHGVDLTLEDVNSGACVVAAALILRSLLRVGHFELDIYPSQSVLQGSLTVLLAGIYLLMVGVFAKVVTYLGGDPTFQLKAFLALVSLVLLAILLQSDRVRLHLRRFVSRHFQRPLYDYRTAWRRFTEGTALHVEQTDLCRSIVRIVADMFQALSVTLWLVDDRGERLMPVASTSLSQAQTHDLGTQGTDAEAAIRYFHDHPEPLDIESSQESWAVALRRWQPGEFPHGGHRVCVPLIDRGEVLGVITLGDRVSGVSFSLQDFDLLKCVGDQAAASLLNVQLAQKLLRARELEAFQTMAAFFVHDLKNAATTLSLMLQNLPVHFDDPAFREDALRGISKTVDHINRLIGRLSLLRHELKIQPAETDLNELITKAVAALEKRPDLIVIKDLSPLPKLLLDQEQIVKVVTNLVLNASEAVPRDGQVRIATSQRNGWTVLAVTDNGCGMSAEFLHRALFRPFQTTKENGLGIGMFQSKMIVEAHGGRIAVESEPGKGTTFQVFLPGSNQLT
jgi:putative PEP-CTERM system histidine kinase